MYEITLLVYGSLHLLKSTHSLQVRAILLDPSCSGSGTAADRLDHLLPSYATGGFWQIAVCFLSLIHIALIHLLTLAHAMCNERTYVDPIG